MTRFGRKLAAAVLGVVLVAATAPEGTLADPQNPSSKQLFYNKSSEAKKKAKSNRKAAIATDKPVRDDLDFKAPSVEYLKDQKKVKGGGGVVLSRSGMQAQADQAIVQTETQQAELTGGVVLSSGQAALKADQGNFNMESETGSFNGVDLQIEEAGFEINAGEAEKLSDTEFRLKDSGFTSCQVEKGEVCPWRVNAKEADITRDGYAHTYDTTIEMFGVPVFYSPYLGFPIKEERQSGLLFPKIGFSSENGMMYSQPIFVAAGESLDLTFRPFIETRTRVGMGVDYRQAFSTRSEARGGVIYSDERLRDGNLRGTVTEGLDDPTFDDDRVGGYLNQSWRTNQTSEQQMALLSDVHLVSDTLFLREMEQDNNDIGSPENRYTTSQMAFRTELGEYFQGEIGAEYNQDLVEDQSLMQQRLPSTTISGQKNWRPFGFNPYGIKLTTSGGVNHTVFYREEGYDGQRLDMAPSVSIPFRYENYFNAALYGGMHHTRYNLDDTLDPTTNTDLSDSSDRSVYNVGISVSTQLERVYELEKDSFLVQLTGLGRENQGKELARVKHTWQPIFRYDFVPKTEQDDLPLFDNLDRIRNRSLFSYGVNTRLLGRFLPQNISGDNIPELTPKPEDLQAFDPGAVLPEFGKSSAFGSGTEAAFIRRGTIDELASMSFLQTYNYSLENLETEVDDDENNPFSDLSVKFQVNPAQNFALQTDTTYSTSYGEMTSWGLGTAIFTDRGDALRTRFSYIEDQINQIESNLEFVLIEQLRAGYYTRYDERENEFIENRAALRFLGGPAGSGKDCWSVDLGYADQINPDQQTVFMSFTFKGLGDINTGLWGRTLD